MTNLIILRGISGSGKSTWARSQLVGRVCITSADAFFTDRDGRYRFDPKQLQAAHAACFRDTIECLREPPGLKVVVDNTNTTAVEIAPYVLLARAYDVPAEIVRIECDLEVALERNIHQVPRHVLETQLTRLREPLPPWFPREQIVHAHAGRLDRV